MNAIGRMGPIGANANMSNKKTGMYKLYFRIKLIHFFVYCANSMLKKMLLQTSFAQLFILINDATNLDHSHYL